MSTAQELLLNGLGASFLTRSLAEDGLASGRLAELVVADPPRLHREGALVRLSGRGVLSAVASAFVDVLVMEAERAGVRVADV